MNHRSFPHSPRSAHYELASNASFGAARCKAPGRWLLLWILTLATTSACGARASERRAETPATAVYEDNGAATVGDDGSSTSRQEARTSHEDRSSASRARDARQSAEAPIGRREAEGVNRSLIERTSRLDETHGENGRTDLESPGDTVESPGTEDPASETATVDAPTDSRPATDRERSALRVLAWPEVAEGSTFRSLEERAGVYQSARATSPPWIFVFANRSGAESIAGLTIDVPEASLDASPPASVYVGYSPTPIEVSRGSFRSVMRVARLIGRVDLEGQAGRTVRVVFDEPIRASLIVLQVASIEDGQALKLGMVDALTADSSASDALPSLAITAIPDADRSESGIVFVSTQSHAIDDEDTAIDAMEEIGE